MLFRGWLLLLALLLCGCAKRENDLIGTWVVPGHSSTIVLPRLTFSPDGTARLARDRMADIQMTWRRLDQERFTLTQADGATWAGCLAEGELNIREPDPPDRRARIFRFGRAPIRYGRLVLQESSGYSGRLTCHP